MTWNPATLPSQTGRTFVITGATAGIGYFAAEQLAGAGAHVVLASRSADKLGAAQASIRNYVPEASLSAVVIELGSFASVDAAAGKIAALPRLDGIFLNGGAMTMNRRTMTSDGLPILLGTHVAASVRLLAGILPLLSATGETGGRLSRVVHASTGFVGIKRYGLQDVRGLPWTGIGAYTKAKTATEVFGHELDRRLRAAGLPVASVLTRPGVGVDAKTPERAGVRDAATPYRRNPYTPWAQGKDAAAYPAVRALTDPAVRGGEYFAPEERLRGMPVAVEPNAHTAGPDESPERLWLQLEDLAGVQIPGLGAPATQPGLR
ncbi:MULTISPECIES: SDR family NAD(P)-dependent oxidoreductase [unclassified Arthrobacter]|uniref:SDR family NAD(P)-dependent oxidoreductase n=1 Tax=unclassified Arthrobacter TaxID=235627 RepID=UPI001D146FC5|nr:MULTISPECIES: SDR family NAD(P)-dependent oxidoreductase [unclassified Arthrobacter]MCC3275138.1 SDR family NAD(P)-dependent oxidoreductase [Arthrobacter sp. zg-Y20]MCC9176585.1 SDR family NAD(P)-dependent oxidoreductase [Arthrobacter sp. zg-Y750]MDK1315295.1 SDR family NAD(P)-dependent oxidoreductase [Arthrobacter sp. zg.Y20]WIB05721.1 SDR family NAD(P)-dependent oxidoreductase [Arthrobacter sp. zg-Y20]